ncbi:MAG: response regulator [Deltaproteobacteria bacterium]|nr:response regulator [Deltaproteobacteria bacterium]
MKILLAEDDNKLRDTLAEGLRNEGYEVTEVANGAAALEHISLGYDAAILDGLLPKMTGFDVAKQLRAKSPSTTIVLMSGVFKGAQQQTDHMNATGAKAYLVKPFDLKKLVDTLRPYAPPPGRPGGAAAEVSSSSSSPPAAAVSPLPAEGNLLEMPALFLGWRIHKEQQTGVLEMFAPGEKVRIFAYRGRAVFAQSTEPLLHIGVELLKEGTITAEQFQQSAELAVQRGVGLFEVLKGEGMATEQQMKAAYKGLVPRIVERTPALTGRFRWTATDAFQSIVPAASSSLIDAMFSGISKITEKELEPHVAPRRSLRLAPGDNWAEIAALLTQACGSDSLTRAINGRATIAQMLEVSPTAQERATRFRQVFVLMSTMAVRASEQAIAMASPPAPVAQVTRTRTPPPMQAPPPMSSSSSSSKLKPVFDSSADASLAFSPGDEAARARIEAKLKEIEGKNHWDVLGVTRGADAASTKKAFYALSRDFHPDSFAGLSLGSSQQKLEVVFSKIQEAYATLTDESKRGEYEAKTSIEAGGGSSDIAALFQAESDFQKVKGLYDRGDLAGGAKLIDKVVKIMANNEEAQGYKLFLDWWNTKNPTTAERVTRDLMELYKRAPAAHALGDFMGWIYMESGNLKYARATFKKVIEMEPKHIGANRGLTLANRKADDEAKAGQSGIGKFFGGGAKKS